MYRNIYLIYKVIGPELIDRGKIFKQKRTKKIYINSPDLVSKGYFKWTRLDVLCQFVDEWYILLGVVLIRLLLTGGVMNEIFDLCPLKDPMVPSKLE